MSIDQMKDKIAKLLAKAEGTSNEEERDAYTKKAEKLMVAYGIEAAELEAAGEVKPEEIVEVHRDYTGGYAIVMIPFVSAVARGFGNLKTLQNTFGKRRRSYIIGHKSDVEMFTTLLNSLEAQAMTALHAWQKNAPERAWQTNGERYIGSRSFLEGFGYAVAARLSEARREATVESDMSAGAALVLVSKDERVSDWLGAKYPKLGKARTGAKTADYSGRAAGHVAGQKANLGGKSLGGGGRSIKG